MGMSAHIDGLLNYEMSECKPATRLPYVPRDDSSTPFKQMMRPDIMLTVLLLAQHVNNPSVTHWRTGKELLRYLKHTRAAAEHRERARR